MEVLEGSLPLIRLNVREMLKGFQGKQEGKGIVLSSFITAKALLWHLSSFKYHVIKKTLPLIENEVLTDVGSESHKT